MKLWKQWRWSGLMFLRALWLRGFRRWTQPARTARSNMSCQESIRRTARCCRCPGWICENRSVQFGSLQNFPRPFTCEFCDIIVMIFGRRPRLKKSEQVLAELEAFRRAALRSCLWLTTISSATRTRRFAPTQFTGADGEVQRNIQTVSLAVKALPRARRSAAARIHTPERGFARR